MPVSNDKFKYFDLKKYFMIKCDALCKKNNIMKRDLKSLENKKNLLNIKIITCFEELSLVQKEGSLIGEVLQVMNNQRVLVKISPEGKFLVKCSKKIKISDLKIGTRVGLKSETYLLFKILSPKIDPLISLMKIENVPSSTYNVIGGLEKQIEQIREIIELPIKFPEIFHSLGVSQPKGVLLHGPPGTGKTLLARAVANHSKCTFIRVSGSELVQKYIGEGSRMVREIFMMAKTHAPSIIFMDEVDSIGSSRNQGNGTGGDSEVQRTMLELLNQLDGFENQENIKILMATNRLDVLDSALIRPGRIDRKIKIPNPNTEGRLVILKIHFKNIKIEQGIDLWKISKELKGSSGAELKAICMESGMHAVRNLRGIVNFIDIKIAIFKVTKKKLDSLTMTRDLFL
jgi:26S proteasome regulatory subunit T6